MGVLRSSVGFATFLIALVLKSNSRPAWVYGAALLAGGVAGFIGTLIAGPLRRRVDEQSILLTCLAVAGLVCLVAVSAPWLPHVFTADESVAWRATSALWFLAVMMFPAAVAFAHDGVLIGAGDYRFLGRAAVAYLVAVAPLGALVLANPDLGIAGIWAALTVWMTLRAVTNHLRTSYILHP